MKSDNKLYIFILLAIIYLIPGCATEGSHRTADTLAPRTLEVATILKFEDVPVPAGFKIIPAESFVFDNDITRLGILKYSASPDAATIVRFYREQMPLYNWRFINLIECNMRIMNFDREDQTCTILIEPRHLDTLLTLSVAPKAGRVTVNAKK